MVEVPAAIVEAISIQFVLPLISALLTTWVIQSRRSKEARTKVLGILRTLSPEMDQFYLKLREREKDVLFLFSLLFVASYLLVASEVLSLLAIPIAGACYAVLLPAVWWSRDVRRLKSARKKPSLLSIYYGIHKYQTSLVILVFSSNVLLAFVAIYVWLSRSYNGTVIQGALLNESFLLALVLSLPFILPLALMELMVFLRSGHAMCRNEIVKQWPAMRIANGRTESIIVRSAGQWPELGRLEDFEDYIFRLTQTELTGISLNVNGKIYSGEIIGIGRSLIIKQNEGICAIDWEDVTAAHGILTSS